MIVAQLVRALDCGSRGRRFDPGQSPRSRFRGTFLCPTVEIEIQPFKLFIVNYG